MTRIATPDDAVAELARRELARRHLIDWCTYGPPTELGPYTPAAWHRDLAGRLEGMYRETAARKARGADEVRMVRIVLIDALPQEGKSELVSRRGPAWGMAELGLSYAVVSAGESLAREHSVATRQMLAAEGARAHQVWPHLRRDLDHRSRRSRAMSDWAVPWRDSSRRGPVYLARGRRGLLSGRSVDIIVTDDLYADESDYESLASRREVTRFLRSVVFPRLTARGGTLCAMGTRWGTADAKAYILHQAEQLRQKGVEVDVEHWQYPLRATGSDALGRPTGAFNYPGWDEAKEVATRHHYGPLHRAIIDCDPVDPEGGLFTRADLAGRYEGHPEAVRLQCSSTYLSVDPAETDGGGDYTVIQHWGIQGRRALLLHQWRGQWGELEVVRRLIEIIRERRPMGTLVEATSSGRVAIPVLQAAGVPGVVAVKVTGQGSKRDRIRSTRLLWQQGEAQLPEPHGEATGWMYDRDDAGQDWIDRQIALRGERPDMAGEVDDEMDAAATFLRWWMQERETSEAPREVSDILARIRAGR